MAVGSPQLWRWWVAGAVKAWPVFNSRSKNTPLSLTWRPHLPASPRDILTDFEIPKRINQLDFIGTSEQLAEFVGAFDSSLSANMSSLRLQITPYDHREPQGRLASFLSSPFPKLSRLDLGNFLPNPSSSIFTTSNLTSLKLFIPYENADPYTPSQFSQILLRHPNLQELDLSPGAIPFSLPTSTLVPFVLPRLVSLRLHGIEVAIWRFINLIDMSSPLNDVVIRFHNDPPSTPLALAGTVKKILVAYYECQGLNHPRKFNHLTISYSSEKEYLIFNTLSRSDPTSNLKSNLRFQFNGTNEHTGGMIVTESFPLFPLNDVREFTAEGPDVCGEQYGEMFRKMKDLSHLRVENQDVFAALQALSSGNQGQFRVVTENT